MKRSMKRRGFTLVELLIVIVVIGILSAMMMLSSTEAVTSARANNIVSNLRNFKTAALAMYVDQLDYAGKLKEGVYKGDNSVSMDFVVKYMNNANTSTSGTTTDSTLTSYGIDKHTNGDWFVYFDFGANGDARIKSKLAGRAKSVGLYGAASASALSTDKSTTYSNQQFCGMWVVKP